MNRPYGGPVESNVSAGLFWTTGGVVGLVLLASTCDSETDSRQTPTSDPAAAGSAEVVSPLPASPPAPNPPSVSRAAAHVRLALDSEGFPGAMIYSQNCFSSIERQFSWSKLDQCTAFDTLIGLAATEEGLIGPEGAYFNQVAARQRFSAAAQKSGAASEIIPTHLEAIQTAALAKISEVQTPPRPIEMVDDASEISNSDMSAEAELNGGEEPTHNSTVADAPDELLSSDD